MGLTRTSATPYKLMELAGQLEPHRLVGKATQVVVLKCFHGCWKNLSDLKIFKLVIIVTGAESCDNIRQSFSRWNDDHRTNSPSPSLKMGSSYLLFFVLIFQITSSYLSPPLSLPLICTHTYTHTRTHMLTLSCSHSRSLALTLSLSLSLSHTHTHTQLSLPLSCFCWFVWSVESDTNPVRLSLLTHFISFIICSAAAAALETVLAGTNPLCGAAHALAALLSWLMCPRTITGNGNTSLLL